MIKRLCLLLSTLLLLSSVPISGESTEFDTEVLAEDFLIVVHADEPSVAVLGLEKNADARCYPASTTKILTCLIAIESGNLNRYITIPAAADAERVSGSVMGLRKDEAYTLLDLLYGMMLPSGNDAALAVAIAVSGSAEAFAERMNAKAEEIGMNNSHFVTPSGLHDEAHYSTARDMALLSAYAMQNELFCEIVRTAEHTIVSSAGRKVTLRSSNRFLRDYRSSAFRPESVLYEECIGIKTGETTPAGKCLIAAAKRRETTYIAVLLHGEMPPKRLKTKQKDAYSVRRYKDARALLEYAFSQDVRTVTVRSLLANCLCESVVKTWDAPDGSSKTAYYRVHWNPKDSFSAPAYLFQNKFLSDPFPSEYVRFDWTDTVPKVGETAGTATVTIDGVDYFCAPIVCEDITLSTPSPLPQPSSTPVSSPSRSISGREEPPAATPPATEKPRFRLFSCFPKNASD